MKLGFVGSFVDAEQGWLSNTARKFSDHADQIVLELHQEHEWLKKINSQKREKKIVEKELGKFCDPSFGLHIPWEPRKSYRVIEDNFNDKDIMSWLRFCADSGIEFVNMHVEWGDGVRAAEWKKDPATRAKYIDNAAENLKSVFSFVESNGIKLSLELITSCLYVEKFGEEFVHYPVFPTDYLKLQKISGFDFGINPDVCHSGISWWNMQNGIAPGIYDEDAKWRNLNLEKFLEKMVRAARPINQIHFADFGGYKNPSEHALALGTGLLTDNAIKAVLGGIDKKAAVILEIKEDWKTKKGMKKSGYLPETVKSLDKLAGFI